MPVAAQSQSAVPAALQLLEVLVALSLVLEPLYPPIVQQEIPLISVAMLKNSPSAKIMLAHGAGQRMDGRGNKAVRQLQFSECQMKSFFVSVDVSVIEIRVLIEPKREAKRFPAAHFVHHDLAGLKFSLGGRA